MPSFSYSAVSKNSSLFMYLDQHQTNLDFITLHISFWHLAWRYKCFCNSEDGTFENSLPKDSTSKSIQGNRNRLQFLYKNRYDIFDKKITLPQKWMTLWNEKYKKYTFDNRFKHIIFIGLFDSVFRADFRHSFVTSLGWKLPFHF